MRTLLLGIILVAAQGFASEGNSSGGGVPGAPGTIYPGTFQGNKVELRLVPGFPGFYASLSVITPHNYNLTPPDNGTMRELTLNEITQPLPQFQGKVGKWSGVFVNASAKDEVTAQVVAIPVRTMAGPALIVSRLTGQSVIEQIDCRCVPNQNRYWVEVTVHHLMSPRKWVRNFVVGDYATLADCEANYAVDLKKSCTL